MPQQEALCLQQSQPFKSEKYIAQVVNISQLLPNDGDLLANAIRRYVYFCWEFNGSSTT